MFDRKRALPVPRVSIYRFARNVARFTIPEGGGKERALIKRVFNESSLHDKSDVDRTILRAQDCLDPPFSVSFSETLLFSWFFHLLAKISNLQIPFEDLNFLRIKVNRKSREEKVKIEKFSF